MSTDALQNVNPFANFVAVPIRRGPIRRQLRHQAPVTNAWNNTSDASFAKIRIKKELDELLTNPIEDISCGPKETRGGIENLFSLDCGDQWSQINTIQQRYLSYHYRFS